MKEAIAVLIPTFNREKYISQCLESILGQTYQPVEVIVYDDGSCDRTADIVRAVPGIQLIEGKVNHGVGYARNQLLQACTTRYAAWQDSDDLSNIYRLEEQYHILVASGAPIAFSYCIDLRKAAPSAWQGRPTAHERYNTQCFASILFDRQKTGAFFFNEQVTLGGEDLLWIKAVEKAKGKRAVVPRQLYYVRKHQDRIGQWKTRLENRNRRRQSDEAYAQEMKKLE